MKIACPIFYFPDITKTLSCLSILAKLKVVHHQTDESDDEFLINSKYHVNIKVALY